MTITAPTTDPTTTYIDAVPVSDMFVDHSYQRELDLPRARRMAETWERPLVGVIEVSDRGEDHQPRYAVVDGQHRYAAAKLRDPAASLVANVHVGLSPRDEAHLFYEIDRKRTRLTTWDRWNARRGAGDPTVLAIHDIASSLGLDIENTPTNGNIRCVSTCEKIVQLGGPKLLRETLELVVEVWGVEAEAFDAPLLHGTAYVLFHFGSDLDKQRLADAMIDCSPRTFKAKAIALREFERGTMPKLAALVVISTYNRTKGPKLVSPKDFTKRPKGSRRLEATQRQAS